MLIIIYFGFIIIDAFCIAKEDLEKAFYILSETHMLRNDYFMFLFFLGHSLYFFPRRSSGTYPLFSEIHILIFYWNYNPWFPGTYSHCVGLSVPNLMSRSLLSNLMKSIDVSKKEES